MSEKPPEYLDKPRSIKELAEELGRHRNYIFAMKRCGFIMAGNRATVRQALSFLSRNPSPNSPKVH